MRDNHTRWYTLHLLDTLRKEPAFKAYMGVLSNKFVRGHTGDAYFGLSILMLAQNMFIEIHAEDEGNITQQIIGMGGNSDLRVGYQIIRFLVQPRKVVSISLTDRLSTLQEMLGFSLTKMVAEMSDLAAISVEPIFGKPNGLPKADIFVLMPFQKDFSPIFDDHILKVANKFQFECKRADNFFGAKDIISDIWELIYNSKTIIADCTTRNPNVFYELGIAHTLGKKVIIITQNPDDIPFDIRHIRYIHYKYTPRGMAEFEAVLEKFILENQ